MLFVILLTYFTYNIYHEDLFFALHLAAIYAYSSSQCKVDHVLL